MFFILDENLPNRVKKYIIELYPESKDIAVSELSGESDKKIYEYAVLKNASIITLDLDFANIVQFPPEKIFCTVVIRPKGMSIEHVYNRLKKFIDSTNIVDLKSSLIVISKSYVRIKRVK